uniref:Uncharacterized protein n=1 Tax=Chenopodium quinoa TaxID=63459 RepID=A0A803LTE9_CHEQI
MGRPPCCDKDGIKKGPWTPEEDIILVSYIQEHGPGNWRSVPTNTEDEQFESMLSFDNLNSDNKVGMVTTTTCDDSTEEDSNEGVKLHENMDYIDDDDGNNPPLTFLEKWLLDESTTSRQVAQEILRLPSIF